MADTLTELTYGEGAVKIPAKVVMYRSGKNRIVFFGIALPDITDPATPEDEPDEMWEGQIIFIPKRKYRRSTNPSFKNAPIDGKMVKNWSSPKFWKEKFFSEGDSE